MKKLILAILIALSPILCMAQDKPAYVLYNKDGSRTTFAKMLKDALKNEVVLFGELHNNPIAHWLQIELFDALYEKEASKIVLGFEMLEADDQLKVDEYCAGYISDKNFEKEARLWPNYSTDYKALVDSAKARRVPVVATNIPRRYAAVVAKEGLAGLEKFSTEAKKLMMPLPLKVDFELPAYKSIIESGMGGAHGGQNFVSAQAVKDATMAHRILANLPPKSIFLHFNGAFHSDGYEGIVWYLNQYKSKLKTLTISTVLQKDVNELDKEHLQKADYIICVPENMTGTY